MTTASSGSAEPAVFGFRIGGSVPLRFLRRGGGVEPLDIVAVDNEADQPGELLGQWPLQGTSYPAEAKLFKTKAGYAYWTSDAGLFYVNLQQGRIEVPATGDTLLREQRLHGMPMILSFAARGDISLHAAAVEIGSGAVVLAAPSRYGKSTLAFACQQRGHRMLSEDLICCRPETAEAIPGPALLRLRPDVFDGDVPTGLFIAEQRSDRIYVGFDDHAAGSGASVAIKAIVFLRESDEFVIEPVPRPTALKDLWRLSFRTGTEDARGDSFRRLTSLAGRVDSWNVHRPLSRGALPRTVDLIEETLGA